MRSSTRVMLVAACAIGSIIGAARAEDAFSESRTMTVDVAGMDLQSEAGRKAVYRRLKIAARSVCADPEARRNVAKAMSYARCVDGALASAVAQVSDPLFQAYAAGRNKEKQATPMSAAAR